MGEKSNSQSAPCWAKDQSHIQLNDKCQEYLPGIMLWSSECEKGSIRTLTVKDIYGFVSFLFDFYRHQSIQIVSFNPESFTVHFK